MGSQTFCRTLSFDEAGTLADLAEFGLNTANRQRLEEVIADCTEAIRLNLGNPLLNIGRGVVRSVLDVDEEAVADYDHEIHLDPDNAAVYLGRCQAKSEWWILCGSR